jgi:hypothetical protein
MWSIASNGARFVGTRVRMRVCSPRASPHGGTRAQFDWDSGAVDALSHQIHRGIDNMFYGLWEDIERDMIILRLREKQRQRPRTIVTSHCRD